MLNVHNFHRRHMLHVTSPIGLDTHLSYLAKPWFKEEYGLWTLMKLATIVLVYFTIVIYLMTVLPQFFNGLQINFPNNPKISYMCKDHNYETQNKNNKIWFCLYVQIYSNLFPTSNIVEYVGQIQILVLKVIIVLS